MSIYDASSSPPRTSRTPRASHPLRASRRTFLKWGAGIAALGTLNFVSPVVRAQTTGSLGSDDEKRFEASRLAILNCQLADGGIAQVGYRFTGNPVSVEPYFANLACLGLLAAQAYKPNAQNLACVSRWIVWYADHQEADGTIQIVDGTRGSNGEIVNPEKKGQDSQDSYAATYLSVVNQYFKASKVKPSAKVIAACLKCMDTLKRLRDDNGFYWNFVTPPPKVTPGQYLLDNVEVYEGLQAAYELFTSLGDKTTADKAQKRATALANQMHLFWFAKEKYFVCLFGDKAAKTPWGRQPLSAEGLATVSALAFFKNVSSGTRSTLWTRLMNTYKSQLEAGYCSTQFGVEEPDVERVYLGALTSAPAAQQTTLLTQMRTRLDQMLKRNQDLSDAGNAYQNAMQGLDYAEVSRYGISIIALLASKIPVATALPKVPLDPKNAP